MADIKRILVPTDFSAPSEAAVTYGLDLAAKLGAAVRLVHVFDDSSGLHSGPYVPLPAPMRAEILGDMRRRLAEVAEKHGHAELRSEVLVGPPAGAIVEHARQSSIDLIVMGTHGRHAVARLLLGSVAERVVRTASCPVLTVRARAVAEGPA